MIRAHMATYPARAEHLSKVVAAVADQVDRLFLVLNEYEDVPATIRQIANVEAVVPSENFKDVGKFYFSPKDDDIVFFVDDDLLYPGDYVENALGQAQAIGLEQNVFSFHCAIYDPGLPKGINSRRLFHFTRRNWQSVYVDQIATGTTVALGKNVAPLDYMRDAECFVDVRYSKWLYENGINSVVLKRPVRYIKEISEDSSEGDGIWTSFTRHSPDSVLAEIRSFAGRSPHIGKKVGEE